MYSNLSQIYRFELIADSLPINVWIKLIYIVYWYDDNKIQ